jgi:hypothetical protein
MSDGQCRDVNDNHYFISLDTIFTSYRKIFLCRLLRNLASSYVPPPHRNCKNCLSTAWVDCSRWCKCAYYTGPSYYALSNSFASQTRNDCRLWVKNHSCENYTIMGQCVVTEGLLNSNVLESSICRLTNRNPTQLSIQWPMESLLGNSNKTGVCLFAFLALQPNYGCIFTAR